MLMRFEKLTASSSSSGHFSVPAQPEGDFIIISGTLSGQQAAATHEEVGASFRPPPIHNACLRLCRPINVGLCSQLVFIPLWGFWHALSRY